MDGRPKTELAEATELGGVGAASCGEEERWTLAWAPTFAEILSAPLEAGSGREEVTIDQWPMTRDQRYTRRQTIDR